MHNHIFDKTDKGREEITTRKFQLASRLRSLLVLVDGKKTRSELLQKVKGLGLTEDSLIELINHDFISLANMPSQTEKKHPATLNSPPLTPASSLNTDTKIASKNTT